MLNANYQQPDDGDQIKYDRRTSARDTGSDVEHERRFMHTHA
jgi:hypothetical protein